MSGAPLGPDESLERIECFRDRLAHLKKRWDNRLVLERTSLAEAYRDGRLELLLYQDWKIGSDDYVAAICVAAPSALAESHFPDGPISDDFCNGDGRDEEVVLVVVVEDMEGPKRFVGSVLRPYLFKKEVRGVGKGLLYRCQRLGGASIGGYQVFPDFTHRKMWVGLRIDGPNDAGAQVIKCSPEIMDRIADDERQRLGDWLFGLIGQFKRSRICVGREGVFLNQKVKEIVGEGIGEGDQLINVAVGPLNL